MRVLPSATQRFDLQAGAPFGRLHGLVTSAFPNMVCTMLRICLIPGRALVLPLTSGFPSCQELRGAMPDISDGAAWRVLVDPEDCACAMADQDSTEITREWNQHAVLHRG